MLGLKRFTTLALLAFVLSLTTVLPAFEATAAPSPTVTEVVQANHNYTTSYLWCYKISSGFYVLAETTYYWTDRPFGGHYIYWQSDVIYWGSRCYVS